MDKIKIIGQYCSYSYFFKHCQHYYNVSGLTIAAVNSKTVNASYKYKNTNKLKLNFRKALIQKHEH